MEAERTPTTVPPSLAVPPILRNAAQVHLKKSETDTPPGSTHPPCHREPRSGKPARNLVALSTSKRPPTRLSGFDGV